MEFNTFTDFLCFSKLLHELRHMIWEMALPLPFLIKLHTVHDRLERPNIYQMHYKHVYALKRTLPVILYVCQESRAVGLKHYELLFDTNSRPVKSTLRDIYPSESVFPEHEPLPYDQPAPIYVDLDWDILHLGRQVDLFQSRDGFREEYFSLPGPNFTKIEKTLYRNRFFIEMLAKLFPAAFLFQIRYFALDDMFFWRENVGFIDMDLHLENISRAGGIHKTTIVYDLEAYRDATVTSTAISRRYNRLLANVPDATHTRKMMGLN
jgi:hypothetical protein